MHGAKRKKCRYTCRDEGCSNSVVRGGVCTRHGASASGTRKTCSHENILTCVIFCLLVSEIAGSNYFDLFKVHFHTFMSHVGAPLMHSLCNNVDSKHCETQVDSAYGEGGAMNILMGSGIVILKQDQGLGLLVLSAAAAGGISLFSYYAFMGLAPIAFVMSVTMALVIAKKQPIGQFKTKMA